MRTCEICSGTNLQPLHRQAFIVPGAEVIDHYDVVCCERCGFVYADNIPSQPEQDAYYEESGRHLHAANLPDGLKAAHRDFFDFIIASLPKLDAGSAVLDVGSSMGHFLNLFKTSGFRDISGLEPSAAASELAKSTYDIDVVPAALEDFRPGRRFDLVTLCGVLEHLVSLHDTVARIEQLLAVNGYLFVAVPDAASFGAGEPREPFLEFAPEHINFFTRQSLDNLLRKHGLKEVASASQWNDFYANRYLLALYSRGEAQDGVPCRDETGPDSVNRYIAFSSARMASVNGKINALADSAAPLIVWGAGSLASRLCATTRLASCKVLGFVDANPQLHGKTLLERPIHPPEWLEQHREATVLIASYVYGAEINKTLTGQFGWKGPVVTI
jgi:hypothetical protein